MTFEEILGTLAAWEGQPVTFASWNEADPDAPWPHRPYHGTLVRRREFEGAPNLACFQVRGEPEEGMRKPRGVIDFTVVEEARPQWAPGAGGTVLRLRQGDVCMELILRVQFDA